MEFDFPLKVSNLDIIPEEFRGLYNSQDGDDGATLNETVAKRITDTGNLSNSLQSERKRLSQAEKALKRWETLGATPDEVTQKLNAWSELGDSSEQVREAIAAKDRLISEKGDVGKQIEQMKQAHAAEINKLKDAHLKMFEGEQSRAVRYRRAMENEKIDSALTQEISRQKGIAKLILPLAQRHVRVLENESNGDFELRVIDRDGDPRVNGKGEPMTVTDLIAEMRNDSDIAYAFESEGRLGSGSSSVTQQRRGANGAQTFTLQQWQTKVATAKQEERTKLMQQLAAGQIVVQ